MNEQKVKGMLGLALRARQAAAGMDACSMMLRSGRCGALLVDAGTGSTTRKKAENLGSSTETPVIILPRGLIEAATGKNNMIMAISRGNFAEEIIRYSESNDLP